DRVHLRPSGAGEDCALPGAAFVAEELGDQFMVSVSRRPVGRIIEHAFAYTVGKCDAAKPPPSFSAQIRRSNPRCRAVQARSQLSPGLRGSSCSASADRVLRLSERRRPPNSNRPRLKPPVAAARVIKVTGKKFEFKPAVITVKKGELEELEPTTSDRHHGFDAPGLNIHAEIKPGTSTRVQFKSDKAGHFPFHCSVFCGDGHD